MSYQQNKKSQTQQKFRQKTLRMVMLYPLFIIVAAITLWFGSGMIVAFIDRTFVGLIGTIASIIVLIGLLFFLWVLRLSLKEEQQEWYHILNRLRGLRQEDKRIQSLLSDQQLEQANQHLRASSDTIELDIMKQENNSEQMRQN